MMSGIICCACLALAISVLRFAVLQWQNDFNTIHEKNELQAKSKPMMNLVARTPSVVSSSTSVSPGRRDTTENKIPWKSVVADDRSGKPDRLSATDHSKLDYDRA